MWPFKRKKINQKPQHPSPPCPHCGSTHTVLQAYHGDEQPNPVRTWRGQRYWDYRCLDCGRTFYTEEPPEGLTDEALSDTGTIDDEDALRAAEDELKRQTDGEGDRRYK